MKLYKIDFTNTIGDYMVTVPTDSQFLIGISNGDSEADVELLDGEEEITPEDEKIGAYTVFNFETDGTPFRKNYKAVINGNNFEDKSLWTLFFDEVNYKDFTSIAFAIPDNVNIENLNYEAGKTPVLTSFQTFVYGADWSTGKPIFHYLETITLTWNSNKTAYEVPIDMGGLSWCKYIQFSECSEDRLFYNYGQTSYDDFGDGDVTPEEGKKTVPAPIPYTQNIDLLVICQKMSVAYRDFEGDIPSGEALVDAILDDSSATSELKAKMQVDAPFQITAPNASTQTIVITKDNYADTANKVWKVGSDTTADNIKNIVLEINRTDFPSGNNFWHFIVSYKFPTDYHYMAHLNQMRNSFKIKDGNNTFNLNNVHKYQNPDSGFILPQTGLGGQTLSFEFFWDETIPSSSDAKFMGGRLINATVDMTSYI